MIRKFDTKLNFSLIGVNFSWPAAQTV